MWVIDERGCIGPRQGGGIVQHRVYEGGYWEIARCKGGKVQGGIGQSGGRTRRRRMRQRRRGGGGGEGVDEG
jgi:hypothetical protein